MYGITIHSQRAMDGSIARPGRLKDIFVWGEGGILIYMQEYRRGRKT